MSKYYKVGQAIHSRLDTVKAFNVGFSSEYPNLLPLTYEGILYKLEITELEEGELDLKKFEQIIKTHEQKELNRQRISSLVKDINDALSKKHNFAIFMKGEDGITEREIEITREKYLELLLKSIGDDLCEFIAVENLASVKFF